MLLNRLTDQIFKNNAIFKQVLGLCPTLAVTTSALNGAGMGLATAAVLACSNVAISVFARFIPKSVRIPAFIVIIACFVTVVNLLMNAYLHDLHEVLGLFIPLIVVNCLVLGRAEAFASKNPVFDSLLDGLGAGIGFTLALILLGVCRELLGVGSVFGFPIMPESYKPIILMVLPPGAFIMLGFLMAGAAYIGAWMKKRRQS